MQFYSGTVRKEGGCHFYDSLCPTYCPQYKRIEQKDEKGGDYFYWNGRELIKILSVRLQCLPLMYLTFRGSVGFTRLWMWSTWSTVCASPIQIFLNIPYFYGTGNSSKNIFKSHLNNTNFFKFNNVFDCKHFFLIVLNFAQVIRPWNSEKNRHFVFFF